MSQENVEIVRRVYEAFNARDLARGLPEPGYLMMLTSTWTLYSSPSRSTENPSIGA